MASFLTAVDKGTGKNQDITIIGASTLPSDEVCISKNVVMKRIWYLFKLDNKFQFLIEGMNQDLVVEDVVARDIIRMNLNKPETQPILNIYNNRNCRNIRDILLPNTK